MFNFNVDIAIECIKSVIDNTQCITCGELCGPCVRFPCGHSVCKCCAQRAGECLLCISSPASYLIDKPQTARFNNASALLDTFQNTFEIDVYKRQRISDHLKVEKLIFPECIQAPHKYSNKRKSLNISFTNKENISPNFFPGEEIKGSDTVIMKKSVQYVQNWLNQHENMPQNLPRRPFGDISVNTSSLLQKPNKDIAKLKDMTGQGNTKQSSYKKRSHLKTIHKTSSLLDNMVKSNLEVKNLQRLEIKNEKNYYGENYSTRKCDKNESGIVLDDEPIVLKDNDTNIIDKDNQAWLAVLEAAEKDENEHNEEHKLQSQRMENYKIISSTIVDNRNNPNKIKPIYIKNVLFYRKGSLFEKCELCNNYLKSKIHSSSDIVKSNDVSIVINNSSFITTIKFTHCDENKQTMFDKSSVAIQTDNDISQLKDENMNFDENVMTQKRKNIINTDDVPMKILKTNDISPSLDVFATGEDIKQSSPDKHKGLIIEDSDTDSNLSYNNTHEVVVEVHKPNAPDSVECGVLRPLSQREYEHKPKRKIRGHTPNSSNSSDKENLDPNRKKIMKSGKKLKKKFKHK